MIPYSGSRKYIPVGYDLLRFLLIFEKSIAVKLDKNEKKRKIRQETTIKALS